MLSLIKAFRGPLSQGVSKLVSAAEGKGKGIIVQGLDRHSGYSIPVEARIKSTKNSSDPHRESNPRSSAS